LTNAHATMKLLTMSVPAYLPVYDVIHCLPHGRTVVWPSWVDLASYVVFQTDFRSTSRCVYFTTQRL